MRYLYLSCLLLVLLTGGIQSPALADGYRAARVSSVNGSLAVQGIDDDDVSYIEQNAVLRDGDVLWTDRSTQAEFELERSSWVRMAEDTKLELLRLPPNAEFRLWTGSVYFDLSPGLDGPVLLRTPAGDVELERDGVMRVDLSSDERARVSVISGRARVLGDRSRAVTLTSGERAYLDPDGAVDGPLRLDRGDLDAFDRYHRDRVDYFVTRPVPSELESDILGARELASHGSWLVLDGTRYWRPRYVADWRPYSSGYWSYLPGWGYTWIDYAPWGFATSHYGRWLYRPVHGWLWCPDYVWGPAYVSWASYGSYIGWAPLDPWGRPCYVGPGSGFSIGFGTGNLFVDFRSWNFCRDDRFYYARHHRRFHGGHGRPFLDGQHLNLRPDNFRMVKDLHRDLGVPRSVVRGITVTDRGSLARDQVLRLEQNLPERRRKLIESRFQVPAGRDRERLPRGTDLAQLQRDPNVKIDQRVARGDEAKQVLDRFQRRQSERQVGGGSNRPAPSREVRTPGATPNSGRTTEERTTERNRVRPTPSENGESRDARSPGRRLPEAGERSPETGRVPASSDRDRNFRRDGRSDRTGATPGQTQPTPGGDRERRSPDLDRGTRGAYQRLEDNQRREQPQRGSEPREERPASPSRSTGATTGLRRTPGGRSGETQPDRTSPASPRSDAGSRYRDIPIRPGVVIGSDRATDRTPTRTPESGADRDRGFRRDSSPSSVGGGSLSGTRGTSGRDSGSYRTPSSSPQSPNYRSPSRSTPSGGSRDSGLRSTPSSGIAPSTNPGTFRRSTPGSSGRSYSSTPDRRSSFPSSRSTPSVSTPPTSRSYSSPSYSRPSGNRSGGFSSPSYSRPSVGGSRSYSSPSYSRPSVGGSSRGGYGSYSPSRVPSSRGSISSPSSRSGGSSRSNRSTGRSGGGSGSRSGRFR